VEVDLPHALHGAEEITELVVDLSNQMLEGVEPALLRLRRRDGHLNTLGSTHTAETDILSGQEKFSQ